MVSDVARLEDDIAVMMRRFQADSEAVTLQMANFAHEFRNPLNVIVGYSELLRDTPDLKSSDKRHNFCLVWRPGSLIHLLLQRTCLLLSWRRLMHPG